MPAPPTARKPRGERPPGDFLQFLELARRYEAVPVVRTFLADLSTPLASLMRLRGASTSSFLLESIQGGERVSRYSFLGSRPYATLRGRGSQVVEVPGAAGGGSFWSLARERLRPRTQPFLPDLPPFMGGAVGYLGYGCARWFEPSLGEDARVPAEEDDALLLFYRTVVAFDHARQRLHVGSLVFTEEAQSEVELRRVYDDARGEVAAVERALFGESPPAEPLETSPRSATQPEISEGGPQAKRALRSSLEREEFMSAVRRAQEHIRAGDAFQIVLSRRIETELRMDPLEVYRALRTTDPAPYMFFLEHGDTCVLGASPETLVRCEGRRLWYRPIAGTRRRGADDAEDEALEAELRADSKEVAEHVMLVDLGRNDLGRVAETGSVRVDRLMAVERYSHVMHLVSSLSAVLAPGLDRFDALAACFPAGTVSGAPKVRAMQIIDTLEPTRRGLYGGAVLYMDFGGNLDACIAIRSMVVRRGRAVLQVGAGVVADSVPEREYAETEAKAGALLRALELAEAWRADGERAGR